MGVVGNFLQSVQELRPGILQLLYPSARGEFTVLLDLQRFTA